MERLNRLTGFFAGNRLAADRSPASARRRSHAAPPVSQAFLGLEALEARELLSASPLLQFLEDLVAAWAPARVTPAVMAPATPAAPADADATLAGAHVVTPAAGSGGVSTAAVTGYAVDTRTDVDMFAVDLSAGAKLTLATSHPAGSTLDSYLRLFNSSGQQLGANDNGAAPGQKVGKDSYLTFTIQTAGRYYIGVSSNGNQNYNAVTGAGAANGNSSGAYQLTVTVTPPASGGGSTTTTGGGSTTTTGADWFSQNLHDATLAALTRSLDADGSLSRTDMMTILDSTVAGGAAVSSTDWTDLKAIVANAGKLGIAGYVDALAGYVVNGNAANATYQGLTLGNLHAGSSATQMTELVDKWFLGTDLPVALPYGGGAAYSYQQAAGQLFVNGPSMTDIYQGNVGDCYLIATLGSIARNDPAAITGMFIDNGDNTWTVRLYNNGVANYVTVNRMLPTTSWGTLAFADAGAGISNAGNELWVALAEKAYVQMNQMGWLGHGTLNAYQAINSGWMANVDAQVLGHSAATLYGPSMSTIINDLNSGMMITAGTYGTASNGLYGGHAYILSGYNASNQTFSFYNPWGFDSVSGLTWAQVTANFQAFAVATA